MNVVEEQKPNKEIQQVAQQQLEKGIYYYDQNRFDSAFYNFNNSKNIFVSEKDSLRAAFNLLMMARIQRLSSDYSGGESSATESLSFLKNTDNLQYKRELLNILGMCYRKLYNYEEALKVYQQALEITEDSISKYILKNNIATIYNDSNNPERALMILLPLLNSTIVKQNEETYARVLNNLGLTYNLMNDPQALEYLKKGLEYRSNNNDQVGLLSSYLALANYYIYQNKFLAGEYANKAYKMSEVLNTPDDKLSAIKIQLKVAAHNKSIYIDQYLHLNDSIAKVRATAKNQFAKIRYDSKVVQVENLKLKTEKQADELKISKYNSERIILSLFIVLLFIVVIFAYILIRNKHKRDKLHEVYNTERRISKVIHDEVANDLHNIMNFSEYQDLSIPGNKDKLINNIDTVYHKTRSISRENNDIDIGPDFPNCLRELLSVYNSAQVKVIISGIDLIKWDKIDETKKIATYRTLQELMVNMSKYSHATLVSISFNTNKNKVLIKYIDNGTGVSDISAINKNGLLNVENRIRAIGGNITFDCEPNKGFKVYFDYNK